MTTKNTPAKAKDNTKALANYDYDQLQGAGFEGQGTEDQLIQPLKLLQPLSPEVMDKNPKGAQAGMLLEPSGMTLHTDLLFLPVYREHTFTEWVPRDSGGGGGQGYVGEHAPDSDIVTRAKAAAGKSFGTFKHGTNELVETFKLHVVLVTDDGQFIPSLIMFSSTNIKVWKRCSQMRRAFQIKQPNGKVQTPPMFAHLSRLSTAQQKNNKGTWYIFQWEPANDDIRTSVLGPDDERFQAALGWYNVVAAGGARVDMTKAARDGAGDPDDGDAPF